LQTSAVLLKGPKDLSLAMLDIEEPGDGDLVVETQYSGISSGTEKLFWSGEMPSFPGMGYPLVPGYEVAGEVVHAGRQTEFKSGDFVFVPGANCYHGAYGLFGGAARRIVTAAARVTSIDRTLGADGALLALAATAHHAIIGYGKSAPDLIVGHGVLGRLLARITLANGAPPPVVWEIEPRRVSGAMGYDVVAPDDDSCFDYRTIYDASGDGDLLNDLVGRLQRGGEIVLAGFYSEPLSFAFPPAFMKEARFRVAAEWQPEDLRSVRDLLNANILSLTGLITHEMPADKAAQAYETAFFDSSCLKMILNWEGES